MNLTPEQARDLVLAGHTIKLVVGADPEDPTVHAWLYDGMIISHSVAGWSAGAVEAVCAADSDFLTTYYFRERHALEDLGAVEHPPYSG